LQLLRPLLIFALACCFFAPVKAQQPNQATFPSITSYSLDKDRITLPGEMQGQIDLVLLSFKPEQQNDIDSWMPAAQALQHLNFQFRYYQVPVSEKENFIFRWWETSSMRSDQTDPEALHWIVPVWVDRKKFFQDLAIPNDKQVVVLLVDRQGKVLWRSSGPITADKRNALTNAAGVH
jgi:ATP10 protein